MIEVEDDLRTLSEGVFYDAEANETGTTASEADGIGEGVWADADEDAEPDDREKRGEKVKGDEERVLSLETSGAIKESAEEVEVCDTERPVLDAPEAEMGGMVQDGEEGRMSCKKVLWNTYLFQM